MTSHKEGKYTFFESLDNMMHKRRRSIVENSFGRIKIHISMVFDIFTYCANLHNLFLGYHKIDVEHILHLLQKEQAT
jgi:hypothetical protein